MRLFLFRVRHSLKELYRIARALPQPPDEPITPQESLRFTFAHADISDDRTAVIIWVSMLDGVLESALKQRLITNSRLRETLFGGHGPLATMAAKIDMGYCVGLYGKAVHSDLHLIRRIRNDFAHNFAPVLFLQNAVGEMCDKLQTASAASELAKLPETPKTEFHPEGGNGLLNRVKFRNTTAFLTMLIAQSSTVPITPVRDAGSDRKFLKTYHAWL